MHDSMSHMHLGSDANGEQTHEHYMASGTHIFMFPVAVDGAAAPKGLMTYDSTQGDFL